MKKNCWLYGIVILGLAISCGGKQPKLESISEATVAMLDSTRYTTIAWKDSVVNFGTVNEGDSVRLNFSFINTGEKLLFITEVRPSCGCTIAEYPKEPVKPGASDTIKAVFATDWHPGEHRKIILVRANTKYQTGHKLIFTGVVIPKSKQKTS